MSGAAAVPESVSKPIVGRTVRVVLDDGRALSIPLARFPRLLAGTPELRQS